MRLGWVFRILAGLVAATGLLPFIGDPWATLQHYRDDWVALVHVGLGMPLFAYCAVFGRVPPFLTRHLSDEAYDDYANAHRIFTEFNVKSVVAAVVALTIIAFILYHHRG